MLRVLSSLHHVTAMALGLPSDFFVPQYSPGRYQLKLSSYPPIPPPRPAEAGSLLVADEDPVVRYGEHTDYSGFTILLQDPSDGVNSGGLQVKLPDDGSWLSVSAQPDSFVVNIGDLLEVWTNGRWRSTVHRVVGSPAGGVVSQKPRLSIPFFSGPGDDAIIEAMPTCVDDEHPRLYAPISAGEHVRGKIEGGRNK
jgi:isopenicillin N synthase-like dioxygenase